MYQLTLLVLFVTIIQLNYACYITNCPIGGKRSLHLNNNLHSHQCPRCGLGGQCFGPAICCNGLACRIGHPSDIRQCSVEDHNLTPCVIKSLTCSAVLNGRCAANGVCCGAESCQTDESCLIASNQENDGSQEERLLQRRSMLLQ